MRTARSQSGRTRRWRRRLVRWGVWALPALLGYPPRGWSATPGFEAARTPAPPHIDGKLDEPAWRSAPVFSDFHQSFPHPGTPPSERTEVRVLYDVGHLYVGVRCFDSQPHAINAQLGRRDELPASDLVWVMIDSLRDRRTGTAFAVNAGGTLADARLLQDTEQDSTWDGAWQGSATRDEQGWSAELRLPLRLMHFAAADELRWGFHVRRQLARTNEQLDSVPLPPEVNALVSRFTELRSLRQLEPPRHLTLLPYIATRAVRGATPAGPRLLEPSADVGLDVHAGLTSSLSLSVAFNPEFSHVEADELIVNLTRLEPRFEEKRPFFLEGLELFEPVVRADDLDSQTLFYSRRIGLELPLLAAVKLSGNLREGLQIGLLDAVVAGAVAPSRDEASPPDRRLRFHPWRPLHFAPNSSLPLQVLPPTNFFAGVMRVQPGEGATLGATTTLATPLFKDCQGTALLEAQEPCEPRGGAALALDTSLRSRSGDYTLEAQLAGSRVMGGPETGELLTDGTRLQSGDLGFGLLLNGGKQGGEPWRLGVSYGHASPRLELNATGFQRTNNEQVLVLTPEYVRTNWAGLPQVVLGLQGLTRWSAGARPEPLGTRLSLSAYTLASNASSTSCGAEAELGRRDLREVTWTGVRFQRPSFASLTCQFSTNPSRPLSLGGLASAHSLLDMPLPSKRFGHTVSVEATWQPQPRLQTLLGALYQSDVDGPRWLREVDTDLHLFADQVPRYLTLTLRQLAVFTPTLTLQAHAQLLSGYQRYERFYEASATRGRLLRLDELQPALLEEEEPGQQSAEFNLNLVLRWEYALGSTLFVVYARTQQAARLGEGEPPRLSLLPRGLLGGPHTDSFLVKLSYLW